MRWSLSHRFDRRALPLADAHYNRQKPGTPQFVPPGRCLVLLTPNADALWVTSWPLAEYTKHEWSGAWVNSCFRREAGELSSVAILDAVRATRWHFGNPPTLGMVTFIDPAVVPGFFRRTRGGRVLEWGYSYQRAGFEYVGWTKGGLFALRMPPGRMPDPAPPLNANLELFGAA